MATFIARESYIVPTISIVIVDSAVRICVEVTATMLLLATAIDTVATTHSKVATATIRVVGSIVVATGAVDSIAVIVAVLQMEMMVFTARRPSTGGHVVEAEPS